ncbi:MAG: ribosomal protein [Candidatus Peribacteria bacterium]|nr:ribosomal protein [Candidatus Peribacteria bacterium]
MESFTNLAAWKEGMKLVKEVYRLTGKFPKEEVYGLTSQMRRSSSSVLANFAEGFSRTSTPDKAYKYTIARGECSETKAFLLIAIELGFLEPEEAKVPIELTDHVGRLLSGLISRYTASQPQP